LESSSSEGDYYQSILLYILSNLFEPVIIFGLLGVLVMFLCSALISGSEVAFFSLHKKDIDALSNNSYREQAIMRLLKKPKYLLSTILVSNNLVNIAIIITSSFIIFKMFDFSLSPILGFVIEVMLITFLLLILGEIAPKIYAANNNLKLAKLTAIPLLFLTRILYPFNHVLVSFTKLIENRIKKKSHDVTLEEINQAIEITTDKETTKKEKKMLKDLVKFGNISVKQIMKNRVDVVAVDNDMKFDELLKQIKESGYSRLPAYEENFDNVKGILYTKDLLEHVKKGKDFRWQRFIRRPFFVPETKKIGDLLKEIQIKKIHLAVVVDEYGGSSGIVTLEDILEEIVGDIVDESDKEELSHTKIDEYNYMFEGKTLLSDIIRIFNLELDFFDEIKGDSDSLAGIVLELAGKFPQKKSKSAYKQFTFTVESIGKKRINKIKLTVSP